MMPIRAAGSGATKPQAGVMATRPATAPDEAPTRVGLPSRSHSTTHQPIRAAAVASWVLTNAPAVVLPTATSDPALKPNQPNHSRPAPRATNGTLCGRMFSRGQPTRLPSTSATARAAEPALTCTAVPPAKSRAPRLAPIQPTPQTQCATGT